MQIKISLLCAIFDCGTSIFDYTEKNTFFTIGNNITVIKKR